VVNFTVPKLPLRLKPSPEKLVKAELERVTVEPLVLRVPPVLPKTMVELFAHEAMGIDKTSNTRTNNLRIPHSWEVETHIISKSPVNQQWHRSARIKIVILIVLNWD
jgi:hypothetical protein